MELSLVQLLKLDLVATLGLSKDALHVFVGLAVFFGAALLLRRPLNAFLPLAMVFLAAALGEMLDMRDDLLQLGYWRWQTSLGILRSRCSGLWWFGVGSVPEVADSSGSGIAALVFALLGRSLQYLDSVASVFLGPVQRLVGPLDDLAGVRVPGEYADTQADCNR